jgi:hypothetical protein
MGFLLLRGFQRGSGIMGSEVPFLCKIQLEERNKLKR